ncbi:MAG: hypothetical protein E6G29_09555 [Actinobacteria bacterium]|nr:MAG: hypothetical protein E6G29_09555 [Actinomycetota bacterium]
MRPPLDVRRPLAGLLALALLGGAIWAASAGGHPVKGAPHCRIFPANNPWNQRVDKLPVASNSAAIVKSIGGGTGLHPDFGSGLYNGEPIGIPYTTVSHNQHKVHVKFQYASESDKGPYPIPTNVPIEGGRHSTGDRHALIVDRDACRLYELYALYPPKPGKTAWRAGSGAIWSLNSNHLRPKTWTSADAAGLPILPGLARYEDLKHGGIDHALRFTVSRTRRAFIYPARHYASDLTDSRLPRMGERLRLKAGYDISHFPKQARAVLRALKIYGMIVADNGSDWYISGAPNSHWNNDGLHSLGQVKGGAFEVVDTTKLPRP